MDEPGAGATTDAAAPRVIAPAFAPGAQVAGRYRLESRLGAGGGGTVWRCVDDKLAMTVALKIIGSEGELERWRREVAMARRIADRNVCRVHDLGEADGVRFVTMELVDGVGLRTKITERVAIDQARDLFAQVVSGVAAIHAAGVVHRDLKPDNVVVASDGRAVIVDFGLAREPRAQGDAPTVERSSSPEPADGLTRDGAIVGTPRYMSPEQAAGELVDARTDVWALGLIGYELITGALPAIAADGRGRVVDADALAAWPALVGVLRRCLAVAPAERYADARALRDALAQLSRRRPRRIVLAAIGLLALAGVAVAGMQIVGGTSDHAPAPSPKPPPTLPAPLPPPSLSHLAVASPFSVALAPDTSEYAYTTTDGRLFVTALPPATAAPHEWTLPAIEQHALVTVWLAGWFADHSVAVIATTEEGTWYLLRVYADGRNAVLYAATERFTASVGGNVAAIGVHENAIYIIDPAKPDTAEQIATIGSGESVMALAISPDASRLAVARLPAGDEDARIQVMTLRGDDIKTIWHGKVANDVDQVLGWLDLDRVAFVHRGATATLYAYDLRKKDPPLARYTWPAADYVGIGSAAHGELLLVGGTANHLVEIGDSRAGKLSPAHDANGHAELPAGWTADGRLVFSLSDAAGVAHVVTAIAGQAPVAWPGLTGGEVPNSLIGDSLIVHRKDVTTKETVIERVSANGTRKELLRLAAADARYHVRCAGDRDKPCFVEEASKNQVTWRLFYPFTGEVGRVLHKRMRRERNMQTAALSLDGKTLAIVEGTSELVLVELATSNIRTLDTGNGVELQSVSFAPDGALWATTMGYRGHFFSVLRFTPKAGGGLVDKPTEILHDASRFFWRPTPSPDGRQLALGVLEFHLAITRLSGV